MSKLKVKFMRYENAVIVKVLEQDESLRGKGQLAKNGEYRIYSRRCPEIMGAFELYIQGTSRDRDGACAVCGYPTLEAAKEAIKNFTELIDEINGDPTNEDDVEITVAG